MKTSEDKDDDLMATEEEEKEELTATEKVFGEEEGKGKGRGKGKAKAKGKAKKAARETEEVITPITPEQTAVSKKPEKVEKIVFDPAELRKQTRKASYEEGEINPAAPPAGGKAIVDIRKMDRKSSYAENEVNPSAPPSPV